MDDLTAILVVAAVAVSVPALLVLVAVAFHVDRSRELLLRYGRPLVIAGVLLWTGSLVTALAAGAPGWGWAGSLLGIALMTGVAIARYRVA